jgi:phosphonate transport system ATP-binding protein
MSEIILKIKNLVKSYEEQPVLQDIDLDIFQGEFVGIIGLSGAGKSTFLRCLNRLIEPTSGEILVPQSIFLDPNNKGMIDITGLKNRELRFLRRKIGMIFQQFNIIKRMTVLDNVLSGYLGYQNIFKSSFRIFSREDKKLALVNLERVGLLEYAYKKASDLSGGEQQRVAIARTLMQNPKIILADEPVASLDPKLSHIVLDILRKVCKEDEITSIVSLHTLELTQEYASRIIGLSEGKIIFDDDVKNLTQDNIEKIYSR